VAGSPPLKKALARIAERRATLVALSEVQRETLNRNVLAWRGPLTLVDRGLAALRFVSKHPAWIVGSALVPSALRPGTLGSWLRRGFMAFQLVSRLRSSRAQIRE
jgi:YqjK-like protein